jgi:ribonuclease HI
MELQREIQGRQGGGGVLLDPRGNKVLDYYWNLGIKTNNRVEAYTLFQGILLVKQKQIKTLNVVGDSKMIISLMISGSLPKDLC